MRALLRRLEVSASAKLSTATAWQAPDELFGLLRQGQRLQAEMHRIEPSADDARLFAEQAHAYPSTVYPCRQKAARKMGAPPAPSDWHMLQPQAQHARAYAPSTSPSHRDYASRAQSAASGGTGASGTAATAATRTSDLRRSPPELELLYSEYALPAAVWERSAAPRSNAAAAATHAHAERAELALRARPQHTWHDPHTAEGEAVGIADGAAVGFVERSGGTRATHGLPATAGLHGAQRAVLRVSVGSVRFGSDLERTWAALRRSERMWLELTIPLLSPSAASTPAAAALACTLQFGVATAADGTALLEGSAEIPVRCPLHA
jgi:hypothetical protein